MRSSTTSPNFQVYLMLYFIFEITQGGSIWGMWMALRATVDASHNYGSKHICCWLSDSHSASGLQVDSLTVWRRNSDDKEKRGTHISSTVVATRTVRGGCVCTHKQCEPQIQAGVDEMFPLIDACHKNTDSLLFGFS